MPDPKRKLAAIVFTDIEGYTKLSASNEPAALDLLNTQRDALKPIVEKHGGEWLKEIGDGLLLCFNTSIAAVKCSIDIQKAAKKIKNLDLRIGIHQGEVVIQEDDVVGDDVNITSRIESFSAVGGIAVSQKINASLQRNPEYKTTYIGTPAMKGVSQKIELYGVISHGLPEPDKIVSETVEVKPAEPTFLKKYLFPITGATLALIGGAFWLLTPMLSVSTADQNSNYEERIAVLYLENKGKQEDSYFAEGLTEEIISRLSRVDKISVVPRFDVAKYKGKEINYKTLITDLEADYALTGNLIKINNRVKILVELIDLDKRDVKWSESFDRRMADIFTIQDEMAMRIVENLDISLQSEDKEMILRDPATDLAGYDRLLEFQRNMPYSNITFFDSSIIQSNRNIINKIIEDDPLNAEALTTRAMLNFIYSNAGVSWEFGGDANTKLGEDSERALVIDPNNALALAFLTFSNVQKVYWTIDKTQRVLIFRKAEKEVNELSKRYPDHYMTLLVQGAYHLSKLYHRELKKDVDKNYLEYSKASLISSRKGLQNGVSDIFLPYIHTTTMQYIADGLRVSGNLSEGVLASERFFNHAKNNFHPVSPIVEHSLNQQMEPYLITGQYEMAIDKLTEIQTMVEKFDQSDLKEDHQISIASYLASCFSNLSEHDLALKFIEKANLSDNKIHDDPYLATRTEMMIHLRNRQEEKAFNACFSSLTESNAEAARAEVITNKNGLYSEAAIKSFVAYYFSKNGKPQKALNFLSEIINFTLKEDLWITHLNNEEIPSFYLDDAILTNYFISIAYKNLKNKKSHIKYKNWAYDQMIELKSRMDIDHQELFMDKWLNKKILDSKNNI